MLGTPLGILVFDIDHFKQTNDTYGHPAGDFVLKEISKVIREKLIRGGDVSARYGGEEFCLLFLGSDKNRLTEIGERIRHTINEHKFNFNGTEIPTTISAGVSIISDSDRSWNDIFGRADKALYQSKNGGRNKVTFLD